jgi:GntP family gluconate:H+ symporter
MKEGFMSQTWIIIAFLLSMVYLLVTIIKFKMNAFYSLLTGSILLGILTGLPLADINSNVTSGFGGALGSLGIVIALGAILGSLLSMSGATEQLAEGVLKVAGKKNASLAMNIIGFIISIPVYMGSAYIILNPLCKSLSKDTKKNVVVYSTALFVGLLTTHCMVIPTPGPLAVASTLGINVGWFILYALVVSIFASLAGGWIYGEFMGKIYPYEEVEDAVAEKTVEKSVKDRPSMALSVGVILLPIILILVGTVLPFIIPGDAVSAFCGFLSGSSGLVALLLSDIVAFLVLKKYIDVPYSQIISKTFNEQGEMLLVLGAGGSFGAIIKAGGVGDALVAVLSSMNISVLVLAFILCMLLRAALGSATVALLTTATILGPVASEMGVNMVLLGLSICIAAVGLSLPTDGGFWLAEKLDNLGFKKTMISITGGGTIASIVGFVVVMILSACSGFLPGLH